MHKRCAQGRDKRRTPVTAAENTYICTYIRARDATCVRVGSHTVSRTYTERKRDRESRVTERFAAGTTHSAHVSRPSTRSPPLAVFYHFSVYPCADFDSAVPRAVNVCPAAKVRRSGHRSFGHSYERARWYRYVRDANGDLVSGLSSRPSPPPPPRIVRVSSPTYVPIWPMVSRNPRRL